MDKRLEMTDAQWRLFHRFNDLCKEMKKEKMLFVHNNGELRVFNGENVDDYVFPEEVSTEDGETEVGFEDVPLTHLDIFYFGGGFDATFGVCFE